MIKDNQQHFNRLHVIIDAFVIVISYILLFRQSGYDFGLPSADEERRHL